MEPAEYGTCARAHKKQTGSARPYVLRRGRWALRATSHVPHLWCWVPEFRLCLEPFQRSPHISLRRALALQP